MSHIPSDSSEHSQQGVDQHLLPVIRRRIEETVEAAGYKGAEGQRLATMVSASIGEFLPTRVEWASAYWARVNNHTDRYLQVHPSPQDARRRIDQIECTESLHSSKDGRGILVRTGLLRRYRGDWVGLAEPNPLESVTPGDVASAAQTLLGPA